MNVHTIKLNRPAIAPIAAPALVPRIRAVTITGTMASVATIGPKAGNEPSGVKQNIASITTKIENLTRNERRLVIFSPHRHLIDATLDTNDANPAWQLDV
jgi:hypothetical protein